MSELRGIFPAIITPFNRSGSVDIGALDAFLQFQRSAGVHGFCVNGTNGEGTSLTVAEHRLVLEAVIARSGGLPVIAGTGAAPVPDAIELTRHASDAGAAAVLVLPSFFFPQATAAGLAAYFRAVMDASSVPVLLYHIPQFSRVPVTGAVIDLLVDHPRLAGLKDSAGNWEGSLEYLARPNFHVYCGDDTLLGPFAAHGATGCISGVANAMPELLVWVWEALGNVAELTTRQARLTEFCRLFIQYPIVGNTKAILAYRNVITTHTRAPLVDLDAAQADELMGRLKEAGFLA